MTRRTYALRYIGLAMLPRSFLLAHATCIAAISAFINMSYGAPALLELSLGPGTNGLRLEAVEPIVASDGPVELRLEESSDLDSWNIHHRTIVAKGRTESWSLEVPVTFTHRFFRIRSNADVTLFRAEGADALGYDDAFHETLSALGQITTEEFAALYPDRTDYLPQISWDPTTAAWFAEFNSEPPPKPGFGAIQPRDFRLNEAELALFKKNGFVVSQRISHTNFVDLYYDVFVRDLPVFVTADSLLHAWSRSYEKMLENLEEAYLSHALQEVLDGMAEQVEVLHAKYQGTVLQAACESADYYLTVARSMLAGSAVPSRTNPSNDALVAQTLADIQTGAQGTLPIFSDGRRIDFSQFKVRGYYESSANLHRYFQAMMWCGLIDFRVAGSDTESSSTDLAAALVLTEAIKLSGKLESWAKIDATIQTFVGPKDSMDFRQMEQILQSAGLKSLDEIRSIEDLNRIEQAIEAGEYGIQQIIGHWYYSPLGSEQVWLPRSFTILGQRFTMDAWALGKVVFDRILWTGEPRPGIVENKVVRRRASALDVAFAVLQNDTVTPEIVSRINDSAGLSFRDGLPYQHNLAAARHTIDRQLEDAWSSSIYTEWLNALRQLSPPTTGSEYPETMRTRAWALRRLNTQLASWTQLRHATILYVKQTTVPTFVCSYPAGFVEPQPAFWQALARMATNARDLIASLPMEGIVPWESREKSLDGQTVFGQVDVAVLKNGQLSYLNRFATNVAIFQRLAEKELAQQPFSSEEETFLLDLVEIERDYTGRKTYSGWYPRLFYAAVEGVDLVTLGVRIQNGSGENLVHPSADETTAVVDVLTAPPDIVVGDPGAVLHEAIGDVHFMLVAADNGPDRMVFGGPVFSHYEMNLPGVQRLTDSEWDLKVRTGQQPAPPPWTASWLARWPQPQ